MPGIRRIDGHSNFELKKKVLEATRSKQACKRQRLLGEVANLKAKLAKKEAELERTSELLEKCEQNVKKNDEAYAKFVAEHNEA